MTKQDIQNRFVAGNKLKTWENYARMGENSWVLECVGEGSDFSVGTMCQMLSRRSWKEIIIHKTSQRLSKKVTVGEFFC